MSQSDYTLVLPAFTIGANAYDAIGQVTKPFGKKSRHYRRQNGLVQSGKAAPRRH